ncbi:MAG: serine O-acetyltransferase EpsC [Candidatus Krumholzibacteriota bacterium]
MTNEDRNDKLRDVTRDIVETYRTIGGINRIGEKNLPSQQVVVEILEELLAVVFPGYHGSPVPRDADLELLVGGRLDRVSRHLAAVIESTLVFCQHLRCECEKLWTMVAVPDDENRFSSAASYVTMAYLEQLAGIRKLLDRDVQAAFEGDPAATNTEEIILCYPGIQAIAIHRLAHPLYRMGVPLLPRIMSEWAHHLSGVDIHPGADIGEYFFIDHGTGVVIGETTTIGNRVKIYQGVTLGALSFPRHEDGSLVKGGKRHPTIGDDVTIYANATILGGETEIGDRAIIGGGAWITESVPADRRVTLSRSDSIPEADF